MIRLTNLLEVEGAGEKGIRKIHWSLAWKIVAFTEMESTLGEQSWRSGQR